MSTDNAFRASNEAHLSPLDSIRTGAWIGSACGAIWGLGAVPALWLPAVLGTSPFLSGLVTALEGAAIVGGLSAVGASLYQLVRMIARAIGHRAVS